MKTMRMTILVGLCLFLAGFAEEPTPQIGVEEVVPIEDLMREHGLLERILLIYGAISKRIDDSQPLPVLTVRKSAELIRKFIEDYHERLEENYLFTRFEKAGVLVELVRTLKAQHQRGRELTGYLLVHANEASVKTSAEQEKMNDILKEFIAMYRPHAAREDTILFPEFKKIISKKEYDTLGDIFEAEEQKLFGKNGFELIVSDVESIEKEVGIYNLSQFTPPKP